MGGSESDWWFGISEGFGTVAMMINFLISFIVSKFTKAPPANISKLVEEIRIPSQD